MHRTSLERPKIWPTALSSLVLVVVLTLGWIMAFDSTLLTAVQK
jgi:hypothetical protein